VITLPLYCCKERRCTDHIIINEETKVGVTRVKIKCLTCRNPDERIDLIVEDRTSVKKSVWEEYRKND